MRLYIWNFVWICLTNKGDFKSGLPLFEQASKISDELKYQYNYSVSLFQNGEVEKAKLILGELLQKNNRDDRIIYGYAVCCIQSGERELAIEMADFLVKLVCVIDFDKEIWVSQIADLYYACDQFLLHNAMYDNTKDRYVNSANRLGKYFYCLFLYNEHKKLVDLFNEVILEKKKEIEDVSKDTDDYWETNEKQEYIEDIFKEMKEITEVYQKIIKEQFKPECELKLDFIEGCYLLDCPRHQNI